MWAAIAHYCQPPYSEIQQLTAHPLLASNLHYQPATEQQAWFLLNLEMTAKHVFWSS
jgi:hypothetical protein